jgi:flagellar hook-length control protein FliK
VQALVSNAMQPGSPAAQLVENALNALQGGGTSSDGKQQPVAAFLDALKQAASGKAQGGEVPQANQFVKSMAHAAPAAAQEGVGGERMTLARGIQLLQTAVAEASQMREAAKPEAGAAAKLAAPLKPGAAFAALDASLAQTNAAAPGAEAVKASAAVMTTASAETAPAASTRPVPLDSIVQTAGQTIRYSVAEGGERTFVMRLHPASLGELRIDVSHGPDGVAVKLVSANQAVREVMESQLHHLRQMLSQDGVEVARLTTSSHAGSQQQGGFSLHQGQAGADQWSNQFGQPGQPGQSGQNGRPALPGGQNAPSTGGGTSFVPRSRHDGNLNLFV